MVARMILGVRNSVLHDLKQQARIWRGSYHFAFTCNSGERHLAAALGNPCRSPHLGEA